MCPVLTGKTSIYGGYGNNGTAFESNEILIGNGNNMKKGAQFTGLLLEGVSV